MIVCGRRRRRHPGNENRGGEKVTSHSHRSLGRKIGASPLPPPPPSSENLSLFTVFHSFFPLFLGGKRADPAYLVGCLDPPPPPPRVIFAFSLFGLPPKKGKKEEDEGGDINLVPPPHSQNGKERRDTSKPNPTLPSVLQAKYISSSSLLLPVPSPVSTLRRGAQEPREMLISAIKILFKPFSQTARNKNKTYAVADNN